MVGFLNVTDQRRLVDVLLKINGMRTRSVRDLVISILDRELGHALPVTRHDEDMLDVWGLVEACGGYPGAMHALATTIQLFYGNHVAVTELFALVDELFPEPLLELRERRELHRLLQALQNGGLSNRQRAAIPHLYREAVGPLGPALDRQIRGFETVVALLEETTFGPDGIPPLMTFIGRLVPFADADLAAALADWLVRFAVRLGLDETTPLRELHGLSFSPQGHRTPDVRQDAMARAQPIGGAATGPTAGPAVVEGIPEDTAYLVIECRPDLAASGDYLVTAWLQYDGRPGTTLHCGDDPLPLSGLPLLLEALLIRDHQVVNRHTDELTIEFVMPRSLLNHPVDQLKITLGGVKHRIGMEYPVIVRSLDRMQKRIYHRKWQRKWKWLRQNAGATTTCWITEPSQFGDEQLLALLAEDSSACLALSFPPRGSGPAPVDEHWVGLLAGTPVILWCRDDRDPAQFTKECRTLVEAGPISLPQQVFALRRKAVLAEQNVPHHLGLQLTLIFDDADRMPEPYARLAVPS